MVWVNRERTRKRELVIGTKIQPPVPRCYVCSAGTMDLTVDTEATTLARLIDVVLRGAGGLSFREPEIEIGASGIYESGEDGYGEEHLSKRLRDLPAGGIRDGVRLTVSDFSQDCSVSLYVHHRPEAAFDRERHPELFILSGSLPGGRGEGSRAAAEESDSGDEPAVLSPSDPNAASANEAPSAAGAGKRKRAASDAAAGGAAKRTRTSEAGAPTSGAPTSVAPTSGAPTSGGPEIISIDFDSDEDDGGGAGGADSAICIF
jgi:hypothetical protein